jgi:hypothetical protein
MVSGPVGTRDLIYICSKVVYLWKLALLLGERQHIAKPHEIYIGLFCVIVTLHLRAVIVEPEETSIVGICSVNMFLWQQRNSVARYK